MLAIGFVYYFISKKLAAVNTNLAVRNGKGFAITGMGLALVLGILVYGLLTDTDHRYFLFAFSMLAIVNWLDDLYDIHSGWRLIAQFLSVSFLVMEFDLISSYWSPFFLVIAVGVVNAYNFMDGINGMSGVYGLALFIPLTLILPFQTADVGLILLVMAFLVVFLVFNFRRSATVILGDVGSVTLGFLVLFYSLQCFKNYDIYLLMSFSMLFLLDTGLTLFERMLKFENVFQSHKGHLYQLLVHRKGWDQRWVALGYGLVQLSINISLIQLESRRSQLLISLIVGVSLTLLYIFWKKSILKTDAAAQVTVE